MKSMGAMARWLAMALLSLAAQLAGAQANYPSKPIQFILPYAAGGVSNALMHLLGQQMTEHWGQPVVILNKPGANSALGTEFVARAPADGYTIMMTTTGHVMLQNTMKDLSWDAIRDFEPVATVALSQYTLVVNPKLHVNTLQEFVALSKSRPGGLTFGSGGSGGPSHLAGEQFIARTGAHLRHVPYSNKGGAAVITDLVGGQIDAYFSPPSIVQFVNSGRLKALAVSGSTRAPALPEVPTFAEAGLPNFDVTVWFGVLAPAGTPKPVVQKLAAEFNRIVSMPEMKEKIIALEMQPFFTPPERFGATMRDDKARFAKLIKDAGLKFD